MVNLALIPGVLGFRRLGTVAYFNGVAAHLRRQFPALTLAELTTDPLGTVATRAATLAVQLDRAFGADAPVHLIAHSMGGLDARYLVAHDPRWRQQVRTIITIGTPHLGSPFADLLNMANPWERFTGLRPASMSWLTTLRDSVNAVNDLSTAGATALTTASPDQPGIAYLQVAGSGRPGTGTALVMRLAHHYVTARAGENDGVVPRSSALYRGPQCQEFAVEPADHLDLIGRDLDGLTPTTPPAYDYLGLYTRLVRDGILPRA